MGQIDSNLRKLLSSHASKLESLTMHSYVCSGSKFVTDIIRYMPRVVKYVYFFCSRYHFYNRNKIILCVYMWYAPTTAPFSDTLWTGELW